MDGWMDTRHPNTQHKPSRLAVINLILQMRKVMSRDFQIYLILYPVKQQRVSQTY